jgi:type VI protein secretion system component Hcp
MGIFMRFGKIKGDATQIMPTNPGYETGWIPVEDFHWGIDSSITTKAGKPASPNRGPKNPKLNDITVKKDVDLSSIALLDKLQHDDRGQDCQIVFLRTGNPGAAYLAYDLKDTLIKLYRVGPGKDGRPDETLTLTFTEITMHVVQLEEDNTGGAIDHITIQGDATGGASSRPSGGVGQDFGQHHHH